MTGQAELDRWVSAVTHEVTHGDRQGLLGIYLHAYGSRLILAQEEARGGADPGPVAVERLEALEGQAIVALAQALALGRLPLAGVAGARVLPRGRWELLPGYEGYGFVWPVLDCSGGLPCCVDLLWLDREDAGRWKGVTGLADLLWWGPGVALEAAVAGERPLRLYRHPLDWISACVARQRAWDAVGVPIGPLLPHEPLPPGEEGWIAACVLDWRSFAVQRLFLEGEGMTVACDDQAHGEAVKRKLGEILRVPKRPQVVKVSAEKEAA